MPTRIVLLPHNCVSCLLLSVHGNLGSTSKALVALCLRSWRSEDRLPYLYFNAQGNVSPGCTLAIAFHSYRIKH